MTLDIYKDVGRNDACPCGSGKKFKKCHMRIIRMEREAEKQTRDVTKLVTAETTPRDFLVLVREALAEGMPVVLYDALHSESELATAYDSGASFLSALDRNELKLVGQPDFDAMRFRVDDPEVHVILTRGVEDPKTSRVTAQLLTMRRNEFDADAQPREVEHPGWRIWEMRQITLEKSELNGRMTDFTDFGLTWRERTFVRPERGEDDVVATSDSEES